MDAPSVVSRILALPVSAAQRQRWLDDVGMCMFKAKNINTLTAELKDVVPEFSRVEFRDQLREDGTLQSVVRLFLFSYVHARWSGARPVTAAAAGIPDEYLPLTSVLCRKTSDTYAVLWDCAEKGREPMTLDRFQRVTSAVLTSDDLRTYIRKFVAKKFRFITQSGVASSQDIAADLLLAAQYGLTRAYPLWSDMGHLHAIAKTAIHNAGVNLLQSYAARKRLHLVQEGGAYHAVGVSFDQGEAAVSNMHERDSAQRLITLPYEPTLMDTLRVVASFESLAPWQRRYLELLLSPQDAGFEHDQGIALDDARHQPFSAFNKRICRHVGVTTAAAATFLQSLRDVV